MIVAGITIFISGIVIGYFWGRAMRPDRDVAQEARELKLKLKASNDALEKAINQSKGEQYGK